MKKILLLGVIDSPYIVHMVEDVLLPLNFKIYFLSPLSNLKNSITKNKNVIAIGGWTYKPSLFNKIKRKLLKIFQIVLFKPFDFILINYITVDNLALAQKYSSLKTKKLLYFWGSDLLRESDESKTILSKFFNSSCFYFSDAVNTKNVFLETYPSIKNFNIIYFGDYICDLIDTEKENKAFNFSTNKKKVAIGYNAREAQQHIKVIKSLIDSNIDFNNYQFIFQLNYSRENNEYLNKLKEILNSSCLDYVLIEDYLSESQLAQFRIAIDIFINAQTTDAFCSSIKEYFYSKTIIINPIWLHYPELDSLNLKFIEYQNFDEIPNLLHDANNLITKENLVNNKNNLFGKLSWEDCKNNWNAFFSMIK